MHSDFDNDFFLAFEGDSSRALAVELEEALRARGKIAFLDTKIKPGELWLEQVEKHLRGSRIFVALLSAPPTRYFKSEIDIAIKLAHQDGRRSIVPVFLNAEGADPFATYGMSAYQGIHYDADTGMEAVADRLTATASPGAHLQSRGVELFSSREMAKPRMLKDLAFAKHAFFFGVSHSKLASYLLEAARQYKKLKLERIEVYYARCEFGELLEPTAFDGNVRESALAIAGTIAELVREDRMKPLDLAFYEMPHSLPPSGSRFLLERDTSELPFSVAYNVFAERDLDFTAAWTMSIRHADCDANGRDVFEGYLRSLDRIRRQRTPFLELSRSNPWDRSGKSWNEFQSTHRVYDQMAAYVWSLAEIGSSHRILDLGSGTGRSLRSGIKELADGGSITLVDTSHGMLREAKSIYRGNERVSFALGDARRLVPGVPRRQRFERITSCFSLQSLRGTDGTLNDFALTCREHLAEDGIVAVAGHNSAISCETPEAYRNWNDPFRKSLEDAILDRSLELRAPSRDPPLTDESVLGAFKRAELVGEVFTETFERTMGDRRAMWCTPAVLDSLTDVAKLTDQDIQDIVTSAIRGLAEEKTMPTTLKVFVLRHA